MTQMPTSKIHVTFPAGCYGNYIMQSICAYSDLSPISNINLKSTGSSHTFMNKERKKYFSFDHDMTANSDIIIGGVSGHELDYIVNNFIKREVDISFHLLKHIPDFESNLVQKWQTLDDWAIREWISFWIDSWIKDVHELTKKNINLLDLTTDKLFNEDENVFPQVITKLIKKLKLNLVVDVDIIKQNHKKFKSAQKYHNLHKRCNNWIEDIINSNHSLSPCVSIIDEAYIQSQLRSKGYELYCYGLNNFPKTSTELRKFIYQETYNDTTNAKTENN